MIPPTRLSKVSERVLMGRGGRTMRRLSFHGQTPGVARGGGVKFGHYGCPKVGMQLVRVKTEYKGKRHCKSSSD